MAGFEVSLHGRCWLAAEGFYMAGFEVSLYGRFWLAAEG